MKNGVCVYVYMYMACMYVWEACDRRNESEQLVAIFKPDSTWPSTHPLPPTHTRTPPQPIHSHTHPPTHLPPSPSGNGA